eukprot:365961-Chlamydomonas_euryale.AAC.4
MARLHHRGESPCACLTIHKGVVEHGRLMSACTADMAMPAWLLTAQNAARPACPVMHANMLVVAFMTAPSYGKDIYYRAHPEDLKRFYAAVDEFHRIYDVVTEFESLNTLASDLMPGGC